MTSNENHCLTALSHRYPQLLVPIQENVRTTDLYKNLVLRGHDAPEGLTLEFSMNARDTLTTETTPAGDAEILFLQERADFEHAVQALAHRCEPYEVPASMGAIAISGLIDWGKINAHKQQWLFEGNDPDDWGQEFRRFTSDRANIRGTILILSSGPYSAVPASASGQEEDEWLDKSVTIRKYHELSHFVSRRMFPENEQVLRDEIVADLTGLWAAYGRYDKNLALWFLGLEGEGVREGGRLRNYLNEDESLEAAASAARSTIDVLYEFSKTQTTADCFDVLQTIETQKIAL